MQAVIHAHQDALRRQLQELRSKDPSTRFLAARGIRQYVEQESRERTGEGFSKVLQSVLSRIEEYGSSSNTYEKLGCIVLIDELIEFVVAGDDHESSVIQFSTQLTIIIREQAAHSAGSAEHDVLEAASRALGHLARVASPGLTYDLLEEELKSVLLWLQPSDASSSSAAVSSPNAASAAAAALGALATGTSSGEMRRNAAILVLTELAENAPALFYSHVPSFFEHIWKVLIDRKPLLRIRAALALRSVLVLVSHRKSQNSRKYFNSIYQEARKEFPEQGSNFPTKGRDNEPQTDVPRIHGALLAFYELLAPCTDNFMDSHYFEVLNDCVFRKEIKHHKDRDIREMCMALLPRLANFCPLDMMTNFLNTCVRYLVDMVKTAESSGKRGTPSEPDRSAAFRALGELAAVPRVGKSFLPHLEETLETVIMGIFPKNKKACFCDDALVCLAVVVEAQGIPREVRPVVFRIIPLLFNGGLTESLVTVLAILGKADSSMLPNLRKLLLLQVTYVLGGGDGSSNSPAGLLGGPAGPGGSSIIGGVAGGTGLLGFGGGGGGHGPVGGVGDTVAGAAESFLSATRLKGVRGRVDSGRSNNGGTGSSGVGGVFRKAANLMSSKLSSAGGGSSPRHSSSSGRHSPSSSSVAATAAANAATSSMSRAPTSGSRGLTISDVDRRQLIYPLFGNGASIGMGSRLALTTFSDLSTYRQRLALHTLGTFDFTGVLLLPVVMAAVVQFLESSNAGVRYEAAVACCRLLSSSAEVARKRRQQEQQRRLPAGSFSAFDDESKQAGHSRAGTEVDTAYAAAAALGGGAGARTGAGPDDPESKKRLILQDYGTATEYVIERLVVMALTDTDPEIRRRVVMELDQRFRSLMLENPENLRSLFVLVNDQHFEVRVAAIVAVGHVASIAPSYVTPALRTVLVRLLTELDFRGEPKHREECASLLGLLVKSLDPSLARPHVESMIVSLLPKLRDPNPGVASAVMASLGEVALVGGDALMPYMGSVLSVIHEALSDRSSHSSLRREVALQTLTHICRSTTVSMWPYFYHRRLLDQIITVMIASTSPYVLRRQAMIALGTIGALDPWLHKLNRKALANGDEGLYMVSGESGEGFGWEDLNLTSAFAFIFRTGYNSDEEDEYEEDEEGAGDLGGGGASSGVTGAGGDANMDGGEGGAHQHRGWMSMGLGGDGLEDGVADGEFGSNPAAVDLDIVPPYQVPVVVAAPTGRSAYGTVGDTTLAALGAAAFIGGRRGSGGGGGGAGPSPRRSRRGSMGDGPVPLGAGVGGAAAGGGPANPAMARVAKHHRRRSSMKMLMERGTGAGGTVAGGSAMVVGSLGAGMGGGGGGGGITGFASPMLTSKKSFLITSKRQTVIVPQPAVPGAGGLDLASAVGGASSPPAGIRATLGDATNPQSRRLAYQKLWSKSTSAGISMQLLGDRAGSGGASATMGSDAQNQRRAAAVAAAAAAAAAAMNEDGGDANAFLFTIEPSAMLPSMVPPPGDYFATVSISALVKILSDVTAVPQHRAAVGAIMKILRLRSNSTAFLPHFMPAFIQAARWSLEGSGYGEQRTWPLTELGRLVSVVQGDIRPYLPSIFSLTHDFWQDKDKSILNDMLKLTKKIAGSLDARALQLYIPNILPDLLEVLHQEREHPEARWPNSPDVLETISTLGTALGDYLYVVLPILMRLIDRSVTTAGSVPIQIRIASVITLSRLVRRCDVSDYASQILHPLMRALQDCPLERYEASASSSSSSFSQGLGRSGGSGAIAGDHPFFRYYEDKEEAIRATGPSMPAAGAVAALRGPGSGKRSARETTQQLARCLFRAIMDAVSFLVFRLEEEFAVFVPLVDAAVRHVVASPSFSSNFMTLDRDAERMDRYRMLVQRVLRGQALPPPDWYDQFAEDADLNAADGSLIDTSASAIFRRLSRNAGGGAILSPVIGGKDGAAGDAEDVVVVRHRRVEWRTLRRAWDASARSTQDDWVEWMRRFSQEILEQSPSLALVACSSLAQVYDPLAKDLFNAAFSVCWTELAGLPERESLEMAVQTALESSELPMDVLLQLLNLAEFMEHDDKPLNLDMRMLGRLALRSHAYAKALHYKEIEFKTAPEETIESLIAINKNLDQTEAAQGVVEYAGKNGLAQIQPPWYAQLGRWQEALNAYLEKAGGTEGMRDQVGLTEDDMEVSAGVLRCYQALGEWQTLAALADERWVELQSMRREMLIRLEGAGAAAAIASGGGGPLSPKRGQGPTAHRRSSYDEANAWFNVQEEVPQHIHAHVMAESSSLATWSHPVNALMRYGQLANGYSNDGDDIGAMSSGVLGMSLFSGSDVAGMGSAGSPPMAVAGGSTSLGIGIGIGGGALDFAHDSRPYAASIDQVGVGGVGSPAFNRRSLTGGGARGSLTTLSSGSGAGRKPAYSIDSTSETGPMQFYGLHMEDYGRSGRMHHYAQEVAELGAYATWMLGEWPSMSEYVRLTDSRTYNGTFLRAVLSIHRGALRDAQAYVEQSYRILGNVVSTMVGESYSRAYNRLVHVQELSELTEIIEYKRTLATGRREEANKQRGRLRRLWRQRLQGVQQNVDVVLPILAVRSMVVEPYEDIDTWLNFAKVCRQQGRLQLSLKALMNLGVGTASVSGGGVDDMSLFGENVSALFPQCVYPHKEMHPRVSFAYIKYLWAIKARGAAVKRLRSLSGQLLESLDLDMDAVATMTGGDVGGGADAPLAPRSTAPSGGPTAASSSAPGLGRGASPLRKSLIAAKSSAGEGPVVLGGGAPSTAASRRTSQPAVPSKLSKSIKASSTSHDGDSEGDGDDDDAEEKDAGAHPVTPIRGRKSRHSRAALQIRPTGLGAPSTPSDDGGVGLGVGVGVGVGGRALGRINGSGASGNVADDDERSLLASMPVNQRRRLAYKAHCKMGEWLLSIALKEEDEDEQTTSTSQFIMQNELSRELAEPPPDLRKTQGFGAAIDEVLQYYSAAISIDSTHMKAWHLWALANFRAVVVEKHQPTSLSPTDEPRLHAAIRGFFRSIDLGKKSGSNVLQDILRLLALWFSQTHGGEEQEGIRRVVSSGLSTVPIDIFLDVIPQLIARVNAPTDLVCELLGRIGREHPQALIHPLTVAAKSSSTSADKEERGEAARLVLQQVSETYPVLVEEAENVSYELIRVAVLFHEVWHEGLEEASRLYFGANRDVGRMLEILRPLHERMQHGAETLSEVGFLHKYGRDLQEASEWLQAFAETDNLSHLNQAWALYYSIFKSISKQLSMKKLELRHVSPLLLRFRNMQLAVPGTYKAGEEVVRIESFMPSLRVISSKQRPRVVSMLASDGITHSFLLKGHEDLRLDERVMQLFSLVNTLLAGAADSSRLDLEIQRYAVVPLSDRVGIMQWVSNTSTLHALVKEYREARRIPINVEHRLIASAAPDYETLTSIQRIEVFEQAMQETSGQDLAKMLWLRSENSETWLDRRTTFTRSLAAMSMTGYVLGLGDRHPSNLLLESQSGRLLHIDFGDCFEVAQHREKYPEKVPFRLTRMLVNAMEASGIEGSYRMTCETVMRVLRTNRESLMTMLEAFVFDPLVTWRLLKPEGGAGDGVDATGGHIRGGGAVMDHGTSIGSFLDAQQSARQPKVRHDPLDEVQYSSSLAGPALGNPNLNQRAVEIIDRVRSKLKGTDFAKQRVLPGGRRATIGQAEALDVKSQVDRLILQATSTENLSAAYAGWCPWW